MQRNYKIALITLSVLLVVCLLLGALLTLVLGDRAPDKDEGYNIRQDSIKK